MFNLLILNKENVSGKNSIFALIFLPFLLSAFSSCNFQNSRKNQVTEHTGKESCFPYDLMNPDRIYQLPGYLNEISGISSYNKNKIVCVQDEKAIIYFFDAHEGKVNEKLDFGHDGDFEDIAIVGDNVYILRSDGTIFKLKNFKEKNEKAIKIETSLDAKNNTEGLLYDKESHSLLITCKNSPSINKKNLYEGFKAIYKFDLKNNRLIEKPEYLLDLSRVECLKNSGTIELFFIHTARKLKLTEDETNFHPSGIAINPVENENIYIISGIEKLLIILNRNSLTLEIIELNKQIFNQPEGICFSENGDLFISNEGNNGKGNILKFKPIK